GRRVAARRGERIRIAVVAIVVVAVVALFFIIPWRAASSPNELAIFQEHRLLRDGAQKLERFDVAAARDSFRQAAEVSRGQMPDEALAWDGVARAESALGEVGRAADAAKRAGALVAGDKATTLP